MVGVIAYDDSGGIRVVTGNTQSKIDTFAAGTRHRQARESTGHGCQQFFGIGVKHVVKVATIDRERSRLPRDCLHYMRMAMSQRGHIIVAVEVGAIPGVVEPGPTASNEMQRFSIEQQ